MSRSSIARQASEAPPRGDAYSRECLGGRRRQLNLGRVAPELDVIAERFPRMVVSDNGTEPTSNFMLKWQRDRGVEWHYIVPCVRQAIVGNR